MTSNRKILALIVAGGMACGGSSAMSAALNFDGFSYTGSISVFDTLSDAQNAVNARSGPTAIPTLSNANGTTVVNGRDGSVFANTDTNDFAFLTAWYFTPQSELSRGVNGFGNPNNTNTGFVQLYDIGNGGNSVDTLEMSWSNGLTQFNASATGGNAGASEAARLWHAPNTGGAAALTAGTFIEYEFDFTATFSTPATGPVNEMPLTVGGFFRGIFENTNSQDSSLHGFYAFDFLLQSGSWAEAEDAAALFRGGDDFESTVAKTFVAPIPVPAALPLLATALGGIGLLGWMRRRQA